MHEVMPVGQCTHYGPPTTIVVHSYDATVLMPQVNDEVTVLKNGTESGWSVGPQECRHTTGEKDG